MVYMVAGDTPELDFVATRDLKEMERGIGDGSDVKVVVQINRNWPPSAQLYEVKQDGSKLIDQLVGPTKMGEGETLTKFVTSVAKSKKFAANNYGLILWGHAYGLGFGRDHNKPLLLSDIKEAIDAFNTARQLRLGAKTKGKLELLGTNACAMSYVEAAYEIHEVTQFMVASQITMPFAGWPYEGILTQIKSDPEPLAVAKLITGAYVHQFDDVPNGDKLAMTALDLTHAPKLNVLVNKLAEAITERIQTFQPDILAYFRDVFMGAAAGDVRPLIDVVRLCEALSREVPEISKPVRDAAKALATAIGSAKNPKLIADYQSHPDLDDLSGVGIYAPFVTDDGILIRLGLKDPEEVKKKDPRPAEKKPVKERTGRDVYDLLDLFTLDDGQRSAWPALVYKGLQRTIPRDLVFAIDGISEMRNGDRADVAQIIMAIDSSLNQLDRVVRTASDHISKAPVAPPSRRAMQLRSGRTASAGNDPKKVFNQLKLLAPVPKPEKTETYRPAKATGPRRATTAVVPPAIDLNPVAALLPRLEDALAEVERTTRRGLTNTRFGLGPLSAATPGFALTERPKGFEPPKAGEGFEPPKAGEGFEPPKAGEGLPFGGDLRVDLAFARVVALFQQLGQEMIRLEQAVGEVENTVRAQVAPTDPPVDGKSGSIERAFHLLQEASSAARRTVRRVLAHPVYGLGPAETELTDDARQDLARLGRLNKLNLRLL